jgi:hypothetical protein
MMMKCIGEKNGLEIALQSICNRNQSVISSSSFVRVGSGGRDDVRENGTIAALRKLLLSAKHLEVIPSIGKEGLQTVRRKVDDCGADAFRIQGPAEDVERATRSRVMAASGAAR